jgi:hypothetical protein|tara:strand:+ start:334 stop:654 length:321 start_codon:yes stop_codon:yes gene_type:complete
MDLINYHFDKPWYRQSEVLDKLCMSNATLKRYMSEQLKGGKTLAEMGYLKFQGFKEACWNPIKLSAWLIEFKLEPEAKYDYDLAEQRKIRMGLVNINNQKRKAINE